MSPGPPVHTWRHVPGPPGVAGAPGATGTSRQRDGRGWRLCGEREKGA